MLALRYDLSLRNENNMNSVSAIIASGPPGSWLLPFSGKLKNFVSGSRGLQFLQIMASSPVSCMQQRETIIYYTFPERIEAVILEIRLPPWIIDDYSSCTSSRSPWICIATGMLLHPGNLVQEKEEQDLTRGLCSPSYGNTHCGFSRCCCKIFVFVSSRVPRLTRHGTVMDSYSFTDWYVSLISATRI